MCRIGIETLVIFKLAGLCSRLAWVYVAVDILNTVLFPSKLHRLLFHVLYEFQLA
jgi:hypothetical protein